MTNLNFKYDFKDDGRRIDQVDSKIQELIWEEINNLFDAGKADYSQDHKMIVNAKELGLTVRDFRTWKAESQLIIETKSNRVYVQSLTDHYLPELETAPAIVEETIEEEEIADEKVQDRLGQWYANQADFNRGIMIPGQIPVDTSKPFQNVHTGEWFANLADLHVYRPMSEPPADQDDADWPFFVDRVEETEPTPDPLADDRELIENMTDKEASVFLHVLREGLYVSCSSLDAIDELADDNQTWFCARSLVEDLGLSAQEAGGIMSSLDAKCLICNDGEQDQEFSWYIPETVVQAAAHPETWARLKARFSGKGVKVEISDTRDFDRGSYVASSLSECKTETDRQVYQFAIEIGHQGMAAVGSVIGSIIS